MKKKTLGLITFILSVILCFSALSGCNLITDDSERDINQVVATISIEDGISDTVYKKDMIMAYMNYGYFYTQYYGYSMNQTFSLILDNLINTRILIQNSMKALYESADYKGTKPSTQTWKVVDYLEEKEIVDAKYNTYKSLNDFIKSYEEKEADKLGDTIVSDSIRTVPTDATNADKVLTMAEKKAYIDAGITYPNTSKAYTKAIKTLNNNNLLGDDYKDSIEQTAYFKYIEQNNYESQLSTKYENFIKTLERNKVTYSDLEQEFTDTLNKQKEFNASEFASAVTNASASSPVLYGANGNYGFVYNLLLGASDIQTAEISAIKTTDKQARNEEVKAILDKTTVKDLRSTWILAGYDCEVVGDTVKFTGDYAFAKKALPFQGTVTCLTQKTEDVSAEYRVDSIKTFGLDEFIAFMDNYLYGELKVDAGNTLGGVKKTVITDKVDDFDNMVNELLFAFSTDPGSLNKYKGYVISPNNAENFVENFSNAGKALLENGGSSYIIVASDYGYHVMFFAETWKLGDTVADNLDEYLDLVAEKSADTWAKEYEEMLKVWDDEDEIDTDSYLYVLAQSVFSSKVDYVLNQKQNEVINKYRYDTSKVVVNKEAAGNLIG